MTSAGGKSCGCIAQSTSEMNMSLHPRKKGTLSATFRKMKHITCKQEANQTLSAEGARGVKLVKLVKLEVVGGTVSRADSQELGVRRRGIRPAVRNLVNNRTGSEQPYGIWSTVRNQVDCTECSQPHGIS
eukprot:927271-Prorocentrum_minimum.AAC.3